LYGLQGSSLWIVVVTHVPRTTHEIGLKGLSMITNGFIVVVGAGPTVEIAPNDGPAIGAAHNKTVIRTRT
jgi:hypothetical protein